MREEGREKERGGREERMSKGNEREQEGPLALSLISPPPFFTT